MAYKFSLGAQVLSGSVTMKQGLTVPAGGTVALEDAALQLTDVDIAGASNLGGASIAQADEFPFSDAGTNKVVTFSNLEDTIFGNVSGDATVAAGGALTIANDAVEQAMIADDAVGADQLAANAVVNASVASNAAIAASKIDFNVDLGGNISFGNQSDDTVSFGGGVTVEGDLTVNGTTTTVNSTTIEISQSFTFEGPADAHETTLHCGTPTQDLQINLPVFSSSAGAGTWHLPVLADAATTASALVTAAEFALLDGGTTVGTVALADSDGFLHNDNGTMKQTQISKIVDFTFGKTSGDVVIASNGAATIQANAVEGTMLDANVADDSSIELNGGALRVKASGVTNAMLAGSIADSKLATITTAGKVALSAIELDGGTDINAALVDADLIMVDDGAGGTMRKCTMSRIKTYIGGGTMSINQYNTGSAAQSLSGSTGFWGPNSETAESSNAIELHLSGSTPGAQWSAGDQLTIKAPGNAATNNLTIKVSGSGDDSDLIDGESELVLESDFAAVTLVYDGNGSWFIY